MTQQNEAPCPQCGEPLECDEIDVGPGTIRGPVGCPACHWTAPAVTFPPGANVVAADAPADMLDAFKAAGLTVAEVDVSGIEPLLRGHRLAVVTPPKPPKPTNTVAEAARQVGLDLHTPSEHADVFIKRESRADATMHLQAVAYEIQRLRSLRVDLADVPTLCAALAPLCFGDIRKIIEKLGKGELIRADVIKALLTPEHEAIEARVDEVLAANTALVEERRVIRQELAEAKAVNAALARQLVTLRGALEFYADEDRYTVAEQNSLIADGGAIAEMALASAFGPDREGL